MIIVQVQFYEGAPIYAYEAPDGTEIGDEVTVPTGSKGDVVGFGRTSYDGPLKAVTRVFHPGGVGWPE